jgi:hypothetical protein
MKSIFIANLSATTTLFFLSLSLSYMRKSLDVGGGDGGHMAFDSTSPKQSFKFERRERATLHQIQFKCEKARKKKKTCDPIGDFRFEYQKL